MRLIDELERKLSGDPGPFQTQLLREDLARLGRMRSLARECADAAACAQAALRLGWTQGDARTAELRPALDALIAAVYEYETGGGGFERDAGIVRAWNELNRIRMERLVGCLATPVPGPDGRA